MLVENGLKDKGAKSICHIDLQNVFKFSDQPCKDFVQSTFFTQICTNELGYSSLYSACIANNFAHAFTLL